MLHLMCARAVITAAVVYVAAMAISAAPGSAGDGGRTHASGRPSLHDSFPTYAVECAAAVPPGVSCVSTWDAVACGADDSVAHLDVARGDAVVNVVVRKVDAERVSADGGFCLAPDVLLDDLRMAGLWAGWDVRPSIRAGGVGLFAAVPLPKGTCLGRTVRVYGPTYFNDWPVIARSTTRRTPTSTSTRSRRMGWCICLRRRRAMWPRARSSSRTTAVSGVPGQTSWSPDQARGGRSRTDPRRRQAPIRSRDNSRRQLVHV